jgi:SAM-dependent methyltransferase
MQNAATHTSSETDSYAGHCVVCGNKGIFHRGDNPSVREGYPCPTCSTSLRFRDQAAAIIDEYARGLAINLRRLVANGTMDNLRIYEPALGGPFVKAFGKLPHYRRSYFWEGAKRGDEVNGVPFEDLRNLSFETNSLDLVITSDVLEHVINPWDAFKDIARVLKVGGVHLFTVPTRWPMPEQSVDRVKIVGNSIEHISPPRFHRSGDGSPSLVVIDYGADIVDRLAEFGMSTQAQRRNLALDPMYQNVMFVSRKMR